MLTQYKLGRIHDHNPPPVPDLATYATKPLPPPAASVSVPAIAGNPNADWGMLGNDQWGDCTIAGADHVIMGDSAIVAAPYTAPTLAAVEREYFGLTGGPDSGLVLSAVLKAWRATGMFGNKLAAYAPVHVNNTTLLQQCVEWFGAAYVGVNLPKPAEGQFKPDGSGVWDLTGTSADQQIEGGHCIVLVAYDADNLYAVTWGAIVGITYRWWAQYGDEAWATITAEFVQRNGDARGISLSSLEADLNNA
ncbi:MAG TPA: hypothetical protein VK277_14260 [Acidimicrobiales bacterium]|nr:hypothetical protein [Acidimicrobiales bacterium]